MLFRYSELLNRKQDGRRVFVLNWLRVLPDLLAKATPTFCEHGVQGKRILSWIPK